MIEEQWYVLDENKEPVKVDRMTGWMSYEAQRIVREDQICEVRVSTVFLGLDHNHVGKAGDSPILFETMIVGDEKYSKYQKRCSTWEQAITIHDTSCDFVRQQDSLAADVEDCSEHNFIEVNGEKKIDWMGLGFAIY